MILVIDDEPALVEILVDALEDAGHRVACAADGEAALALMNDGVTPCLALLDLMMPRMNGWELRRAMLAEPTLSTIPVAIMSAHAAETAEDLQAVAVIRKPFTLDEVVDLADRHCSC